MREIGEEVEKKQVEVKSTPSIYSTVHMASVRLSEAAYSISQNGVYLYLLIFLCLPCTNFLSQGDNCTLSAATIEILPTRIINQHYQQTICIDMVLEGLWIDRL